MWEPLKPIARPPALALGIAFFVAFFAVWAAVTFGGVVPPMFLKDPVATFATGVELFGEYGFLYDIGITISNGKGAIITMTGPTVDINMTALTVT